MVDYSLQTLKTSDKKSLEMIPDVPGLLAYRADKKQLYVNEGSKWKALNDEQEVGSLIFLTHMPYLLDMLWVFLALRFINLFQEHLAIQPFVSGFFRSFVLSNKVNFGEC